MSNTSTTLSAGKTSEWEKEFNKNFPYLTKTFTYMDVSGGMTGVVTCGEEVKSFISDLLAKEKMELVNRIEMMKKDSEYHLKWSGQPEKYRPDYTQALDGVLSALKSEIQEEVGG